MQPPTRREQSCYTGRCCQAKSQSTISALCDIIKRHIQKFLLFELVSTWNSPTAQSLTTSLLYLPQATPTVQKSKTCLSTRGKSQTTLCSLTEAQHAGLQHGGARDYSERAEVDDLWPFGSSGPTTYTIQCLFASQGDAAEVHFSSVEAAAIAETPLTRSRQVEPDSTFFFFYSIWRARTLPEIDFYVNDAYVELAIPNILKGDVIVAVTKVTWTQPKKGSSTTTSCASLYNLCQKVTI